MNLEKTKDSGDSLLNLKRDDGTDFRDQAELKSYVEGYYKDIYKQYNNRAKNCTDADINYFLGTVSENPIVNNAKLTNAERDELESEVTELELTQSINNANMASAPGVDGVGNRFIKNFWEFFKNPLLKLCNKCHIEGRLPLFF